MLRNGQSQTKPGERNEIPWTPLCPTPEPWSPEERRERNSGTAALRESVEKRLRNSGTDGTPIEDKNADA